MTPKTLAVSEKDAQVNSNYHHNGYVCIAISDSAYDSKTKATYETNFDDVLFLEFLDLDYKSLNAMSKTQKERYIDRVFTKEQADEIIDFATKHKDRNILVHCAAGISRSQAVALFIAKYIFKNNNLFNLLYHDDSKIEGGNNLVYRTLTDRLYAREHTSDTFDW